MGLDTGISLVETNEDKIMLLKLENKENNKEVLYWRKDYVLTDYFVELWGLDNCEEKELSKEDIEALKKFFKENVYTNELKKLNSTLKKMNKTQKLVFWAW